MFVWVAGPRTCTCLVVESLGMSLDLFQENMLNHFSYSTSNLFQKWPHSSFTKNGWTDDFMLAFSNTKTRGCCTLVWKELVARSVAKAGGCAKKKRRTGTSFLALHLRINVKNMKGKEVASRSLFLYGNMDTILRAWLGILPFSCKVNCNFYGDLASALFWGGDVLCFFPSPPFYQRHLPYQVCIYIMRKRRSVCVAGWWLGREREFVLEPHGLTGFDMLCGQRVRHIHK